MILMQIDLLLLNVFQMDLGGKWRQIGICLLVRNQINVVIIFFIISLFEVEEKAKLNLWFRFIIFNVFCNSTITMNTCMND